MKEYLLVLHHNAHDHGHMIIFSVLLALTALLALATVGALALAGLRSGDLPQDPRVEASLHWSLEADGWVPHAGVAVHNSSPSSVVVWIEVRPTPSWLGSIRNPLSVSVSRRGPAHRGWLSADTMFVVEGGERATSEVAFAPTRYATVTATLHQDGGRVRVWKATLPLLAAPSEHEAPAATLYKAA
jgi:hypothetical protein